MSDEQVTIKWNMTVAALEGREFSRYDENYLYDISKRIRAAVTETERVITELKGRRP